VNTTILDIPGAILYQTRAPTSSRDTIYSMGLVSRALSIRTHDTDTDVEMEVDMILGDMCMCEERAGSWMGLSREWEPICLPTPLPSPLPGAVSVCRFFDCVEGKLTRGIDY
jgi:hypothetical protein